MFHLKQFMFYLVLLFFSKIILVIFNASNLCKNNLNTTSIILYTYWFIAHFSIEII